MTSFVNTAERVKAVISLGVSTWTKKKNSSFLDFYKLNNFKHMLLWTLSGIRSGSPEFPDPSLKPSAMPR